jgi:hypothetical protein
MSLFLVPVCWRPILPLFMCLMRISCLARRLLLWWSLVKWSLQSVEVIAKQVAR